MSLIADSVLRPGFSFTNAWNEGIDQDLLRNSARFVELSRNLGDDV